MPHIDEPHTRCVDEQDWLILSYKKVTWVEYVLTCLTFLAVVFFGLTIGLISGLLLAALFFSVSYARVHVKAFSVLPSRGCAVRTFEQRTILGLFSGTLIPSFFFFTLCGVGGLKGYSGR